MKSKMEEKVELKGEDKTEIQELFDDLFVDQINQKFDNFSCQTNEGVDEIKKDIKEQKKQYVVIRDEIQKVNEILQCVGTEYDWEGGNLVDFLNEIAKLCGECKNEVKKHTNFFGNKVEDISLFESLENIEVQLVKIYRHIEDVVNRTEKSDRILKEFKNIDIIVNSLQSIEDELKILGSVFDKHKEYVAEIDEKIDSLSVSIGLLTSKMSDCVEMRETEIVSLGDSFLEKVDRNMLQSKKGFACVFAGMGFLLLSNIVMFILLLIK